MSEPHWTGYVGMFTGIAGAIMGFVSYRRSNKIKSLDLRIELRKSIEDLHSNFSKLENMLVQADNSRVTVYAKAGLSDSSAMTKWKKDIEADKQNLKEIIKNALKSDWSFDKLNPNKLEDKIIDVHQLQNQIKELLDKYVSALEDNEVLRRELNR